MTDWISQNEVKMKDVPSLIQKLLVPTERVFHIAKCTALQSQFNVPGQFVVTTARVSFLPKDLKKFAMVEIQINQLRQIDYQKSWLHGNKLIICGTGKRELILSKMELGKGSPIQKAVDYLDAQIETLRKAAAIRSQLTIKKAERLVDAWDGTSKHDGVGAYPPNWDELRSAIYARDSYECANCLVNGPNVEFHAHHIVPLGAGGTNNPSNLKTLCRSCHEKIHSYYGRPI